MVLKYLIIKHDYMYLVIRVRLTNLLTTASTGNASEHVTYITIHAVPINTSTGISRNSEAFISFQFLESIEDLFSRHW